MEKKKNPPKFLHVEIVNDSHKHIAKRGVDGTCSGVKTTKRNLHLRELWARTSANPGFQESYKVGVDPTLHTYEQIPRKMKFSREGLVSRVKQNKYLDRHRGTRAKGITTQKHKTSEGFARAGDRARAGIKACDTAATDLAIVSAVQRVTIANVLRARSSEALSEALRIHENMGHETGKMPMILAFPTNLEIAHKTIKALRNLSGNRLTKAARAWRNARVAEICAKFGISHPAKTEPSETWDDIVSRITNY